MARTGFAAIEVAEHSQRLRTMCLVDLIQGLRRKRDHDSRLAKARSRKSSSSVRVTLRGSSTTDTRPSTITAPPVRQPGPSSQSGPTELSDQEDRSVRARGPCQPESRISAFVGQSPLRRPGQRAVTPPRLNRARIRILQGQFR